MQSFYKGAIAALLVAASTTFGSEGAQAQGWMPSGPITLKIAFAAGGGADTQARLIAAELESRYGWTIIPEQAAGRGGLSLLADIRDDPADGTVIGMTVTDSLGYSSRASEAPWTPADFTPIATTASFQMGLVASAGSGWASFPDLLDAARGGQVIRFGVMSAKLADQAYLLGEANDVAFNIVELNGGAAVMNGITAGDIDVGFVAGAQSRGVASGDLVNLASALSAPLTQTPDAPLLSEFGLPFDSDGYFVFITPAGLPEEARTALAEAISAIASDPSNPAGEAIQRAFGEASTLSGSALTDFLTRQYDDAGALMDAASN